MLQAFYKADHPQRGFIIHNALPASAHRKAIRPKDHGSLFFMHFSLPALCPAIIQNIHHRIFFYLIFRRFLRHRTQLYSAEALGGDDGLDLHLYGHGIGAQIIHRGRLAQTQLRGEALAAVVKVDGPVVNRVSSVSSAVPSPAASTVTA